MKKIWLSLHITSALVQSLFFPLLHQKIRKYLIKKWSIRLLKILKVKVVLHGSSDVLQQQGAFLLVANHISWLDIHVLNSIRPVTFVAKSDVSSWPIFGYIAKSLGTIFLKREKLSDIKRVIYLMNQKISSSEVVAIFPEGTSSDGRCVLPFKSNLFQAAIDAQGHVLPIRLSYKEHGAYTDRPAFIGDMSLIQSIEHILASNHLEIELHVCAPLSGYSSRQELAQHSYKAIATSFT